MSEEDLFCIICKECKFDISDVRLKKIADGDFLYIRGCEIFRLNLNIDYKIRLSIEKEGKYFD